ncbi:MAG: restriction endonuclease subunit S [Desulfarculus sp.]|nr:restriction endonuclease subunit S [Desulfarculus sp.]
MMEWTTRSLGKICDDVGGIIKTGPFGSQLHQSDYSEVGTPVVMPKDLIGGRISEGGIARVGDSHVQRLSHHKLKPGDIVYGRRGDIGRCALITQKEAGWLCGTGCLRVSLGSSPVDPQFLYYFLYQPAMIAWITNQAIGATMPNLNTNILRSVPITYPDLPSQRRIAAILSAYDDLIENNTRRIAILEDMARMIYQEWFVRFRFPGHEQVRMVESELGQIPEGWEVGKLGAFIELAYGKALKADGRIAGPFPVYGSSGVVGYHNEGLVTGPGIIVGRKGNVGSVHWSDDPFWPIDTVYFVRTDTSLRYVFFNLQGQNFINNDAAVPGLNRNQAYSLPFVLKFPRSCGHLERVG